MRDVLGQEDESSNQLRAEIPTLIPADSSEEERVRDRETHSQPRRTRTLRLTCQTAFSAKQNAFFIVNEISDAVTSNQRILFNQRA